QFECKRDTQALHCHSLKETGLKQQGKTRARRRLLITCAVCLIFMIGEVIGGYAAHSLAIMTDAAHLLTDFGSISISLFSLWISSRPPSKHLTFGWHRSGVCVYIYIYIYIYMVKKNQLNVDVSSEGVPCGVDFDSVKDGLLSVGGVKSTHSLRMWALTASETQLSMHAVIDEQTNPQTVLMDMTRLLQTEYGFSNITIQTETHTDDVAYCLQCQDPM
uniref:Solute carrier family 30 member 2 n=1 Tax=Sinocyclocheilus grahami TaxID=75366 RepID=A0A672LVB3_SINGR